MDGSDRLPTARVEWTHETVYWPRRKEPEMTAEERAARLVINRTWDMDVAVSGGYWSEAIAEAIREAVAESSQPLSWTQEPPKVPGWYWWRGENRQAVEVLHIDMPEKVAEYFLRGEWAGPLTPPERPS